ncbi:MAG: fatty acid cis/trans isomerase [Halioglobus sp.]
MPILAPARLTIRAALLALPIALLALPTAAQSPRSDQALGKRADQIMQQRCLVCHGCYDAPCQLKLEAPQGLRRGASKDLVYDSTRLIAGDLTRLFDDGHSERDWRKKGFYPVLDQARPGEGVLYRMLELKRDNPLPAGGPLPDGFDFSLYRDQQCPKQGEFDDFQRDYPQWGMPYGLPGLAPEEHAVMVEWLERGAPAAPLRPLSPSVERAVAQWEAFLNGRGKREKLMSRYLYEHLFLAALHFEQGDEPAWFRLVRSASPPGRPLELLATRRPYDDPGRKSFYYRLQRMPTVPLAKTHMPYLLDTARMGWYRQLFLEPDYTVERLPGYTPKLAANPFRTFRAIPVASRYRFLLDEAQFTIMNFIKGPVCRGQVALNVIDDQFWVMFANPDNIDPDNDAEFLARESDNLQLPVAKTGTVIDMLAWRRYARAHENYQRARRKHLEERLQQSGTRLDYDSLWDGDGHNDNAALTIFRHFDTASVVKGFVGDVPKTAWVIGYPLLERIHYLLVAGYDVYGAVSHQLASRLYMDFLRMEGEFNFLLFMPPQERLALHAHWYRGAEDAEKHFQIRNSLVQRPTDIAFTSKDPKRELLQTMQERIPSARAQAWDYHGTMSGEATRALDSLVQNRGSHNSFLPETSFVNIVSAQSDTAITLVRNSGFSNIAELFREEERRLPEEDSLTIVHGFLGAYPNYFFQVNEKEVPRFAAQIAALDSPEAFGGLRERYGVRRNAPWFWRLSDKFHRMYQAQDPVTAGVFDYNRYRGD